METAPLPHLSGPAPLPRDIKRAHVALWLSGGGWMLIILCLTVLVAFVMGSAGEGEATGLLNSRQYFPALVTSRVIAGGGAVLCFAGMVLGLGARKHRRGKAAAVLGGANFLMVLMVALAVFLTNRK